jgi:phosphoglycerol transferase MdoB-like AlkP superfamily enzyme
VIYGPEALGGTPPPLRRAGSHLDLVPTLVEICAPAGFVYQSFGGNLLSPQRPAVGYGNGVVITPEAIFRANDPGHAEPWSSRTPTENPAPEDRNQLMQNFRSLHGLSWWRVMRGPALPDAPKTRQELPQRPGSGFRSD